jgi:hypothetical protein
MNAAALLSRWHRQCRAQHGGGYRAPVLLRSARALLDEHRRLAPRHWLALTLMAMEGVTRTGASPSLIYHTLEAMLGLPESPTQAFDLGRLMTSQRRQSIREYGRTRPLYDVAADFRDAIDYAERELRDGPRRHSLSHLEQWCVLLLIALEGCWRSHPSIPAVNRALAHRVKVQTGVVEPQ